MLSCSTAFYNTLARMSSKTKQNAKYTSEESENLRVNGFKLCRVRAGMTQDEAAELLGVSRITVYSWERGTYKPSADMLLKISEVYRCTIDELLKGEERK